MPPLRILLLLAAMAGLAACAGGGVRLTQQEAAPTYSPGEFAYAGAGRDLRVVVLGNPFGGDPAAFARAVTDAMQGRHWGQRANFTTEPGPSARQRYRVVMLFDPGPGLNRYSLCDEPAESLPRDAAGEGVTLFAAFCRGKRLRSSIKGYVGAASGTSDPAFRELVGQVTNGLFPPDRGLDRERGDPRWLWP